MVHIYRQINHLEMGNKKKPLLDRDFAKLMEKISQNIKRVRIKKGMTQEDMLSLGFERRWYQRIESGKYSVSLSTLHNLAKSLKTDISEFFK